MADRNKDDDKHAEQGRRTRSFERIQGSSFDIEDVAVGIVAERPSMASYFQDFTERKLEAGVCQVPQAKVSGPRQSVASYFQEFADQKKSFWRHEPPVPTKGCASPRGLEALEDAIVAKANTSRPRQALELQELEDAIAQKASSSVPCPTIQQLEDEVLKVSSAAPTSAPSGGKASGHISFLQDIRDAMHWRPLPLGIGAIPGAHAVGGVPTGFRMLQWPRSNRNNSSRNDTTPEPLAPAFPSTPFEANLVEQVDSSDELDCLDKTHESADTLEVIMGAPLPDPVTTAGNSTKARRLSLFFISLFVVVAVAASLTIAWAVSRRGSNQMNGSSSPSTAIVPLPSLSPEFHEGLQETTKDGELQDPSSPQARAYLWMQNDPHLGTYPVWQQLQRFAMVTWYYALNGDSWRVNQGWLDYAIPECEWAMESVPDYPGPCDEDGRIVIANQPHNNLTGSIPPQSRILKGLRYVDLGYNQITGELPVLGTGGSLEVMIFSHNYLIGLMKGAGGHIINSPLRILKLDGNRFSSHNGDAYRFFPHMEILNMTSNLYKDEVPFQLKYVKKLKYLGMGDNLYYGSLPTELGLLSNLEGLDVSGNSDIVGSIPSQLGLLGRLTSLDVSGTNVEAPFPDEVCALRHQKLDYLMANCSGNQDCCEQP